MSRSYRKPYSTICGGTAPETNDKQTASRCWRRLMKQSLHNADWDWYLIPVRFEAACNERWCWSADGSNQLDLFPSRLDRQRLGDGDLRGYERARHWHEQLKRK